MSRACTTILRDLLFCEDNFRRNRVHRVYPCFNCCPVSSYPCSSVFISGSVVTLSVRIRVHPCLSVVSSAPVAAWPRRDATRIISTHASLCIRPVPYPSRSVFRLVAIRLTRSTAAHMILPVSRETAARGCNDQRPLHKRPQHISEACNRVAGFSTGRLLTRICQIGLHFIGIGIDGTWKLARKPSATDNLLDKRDSDGQNATFDD